METKSICNLPQDRRLSTQSFCLARSHQGRKRWLLAFAAATIVPLLPYALSGQDPDAASSGGDSDSRSLHVGLGVVTAVTANPSRWHYAGGLIANVEWRGWGVMAVGTLGRGGAYESTFVAGAATRRLLRVGGLSLTGLAGYGLYGEEAPNGASRDDGGIMLGGVAKLRVGVLSLSLMATDLRGHFDGLSSRGFPVHESFEFEVLRYSLVIGVGGGG